MHRHAKSAPSTPKQLEIDKYLILFYRYKTMNKAYIQSI